MQALRVVGISEDGGEVSVVLEDPARRERYRVRADERLRAAARGDVTRLGQIAIELESQLRPREIQARIRAGESVEQVAAAAGAPAQKIERFAYPVLLERSRTAELARRAHPVRAEGPDARTLEEVVSHTFGLRGQEYEKADWDSWKGEDGRWVAALSWRAGRSDNTAHWTYQPGAHGGTVTALDENAGDLVEGLPARPLRTVGPVIDMSLPGDEADGGDAPAPVQGPEPLRAAAGADTVRPEQARDRSGPPRPVAPEPRRPAQSEQGAGAVGQRGPEQAGPPAPGPRPASAGQADSSAGGSPGAGPASGGPVAAPRGEVAERTEDGERAGRDGAAAADTAVGPDAATGGADGSGGDRPGRGAPAKRTRKGKPVMPSWDEVLLGVRGQH